MSPNRRGGDRIAGMGNKTSPCKTSVLNLGKTPRVPGLHVVDKQEDATKRLPAKRDAKHSLPTNRRIMSLLSMAVVPEERRAFRRRFRRASKEGEGGETTEPTSSNFCRIPIGWVAEAFQCEPFQLRCAGDMFPESRIESEFLNEFYVMDVILNRAPSPARMGDLPDNDNGKRHDVDPDVVRPFRSYEPEDVLPGKDYCYRAAILFLPQCGKFYCHRERRRGDVGVPGTFVAHDMSWLRLQRTESHGGREVSYSFGADSFVKRFFWEFTGHGVCHDDGRPGQRYLDGEHRVSARRISTGRTRGTQQNRVIYRAVQCHDADGPMLAPDLLQGNEFDTCPHDYLAAEYQLRLASSSSAKRDGRHYVGGYLHYRLPASCWMIDADETHFVDLMVDVDTTVGGTRNRQSVVMIRNVTRIDANDEYLGLLGRVTAHNTALRKAEAKGYARHKCEDVGTMHAIGTRIPLDSREGTTAPYAANGKVPDGVLRGLVVDLATLGRRCFPQVYSVVRDIEGDSGLLPVEPMDGVCLTDDSKEMASGGEHEALDRPGLDTALERGAELVDESAACVGGLVRKMSAANASGIPLT